MSDTGRGNTRKRLGRPPKPKNEARSERVVTFVTPDQLENLKGIATAEGSSISSVVHHMLASALTEDDSRSPG
jgi:hypothetical protein